MSTEALTVREKFLAVEADMNTAVLDRHQAVHSMMLALASESHVFFLGKPGIAKSMLVDELAKRIGARHFKWLLTMFTNDNEIFGPPDVAALQGGTFRRVIDGKLPWAEVAFLDEIFKASPSILNALLMIINEREFHNPGDDIHVPLVSLFAASNELPQSSELEALVDRLTLRHVVTELTDDALFVQMLALENNPPNAFMTMDDIKEAQGEVNAIHVGDHIYSIILDLKSKLEDENIHISDRRYRQSIKVIKAEAWMNGHTEAEVVDTVPLMHMFWRDPEQRQNVRRIILDLADPLERDVASLREELDKMYSQFEMNRKDASNENDLAALALEAYKQFREAKSDYRTLKARANESGRTSPSLSTLRLRLREVGPSILQHMNITSSDDDLDEDEA